MIVCLDVYYAPGGVTTAGVGLKDWPDEGPWFERTLEDPTPPEAYVPGAFYRRELPYLCRFLTELPFEPRIVVVDGHVWLGEKRPGLGWHLYTALHERIPVVGLAKNAFAGASATPVCRGESQRPLFVTTIGMPLEEGVRGIETMAGPYRMPNVLKRVDFLSRHRV